MARLNDPPAPMETIDALKRRFIRQNREIARVNSTQSLRIRTLESEISHLLSENIALRQHIIRLQYDIDRYSDGVRLNDMGGIKEKLEAKLTEIGGLVQELGKIQTDAANRRSPKRRALSSSSPKKSPDQKVWKNVLSLAEVTGGADGRLPPIVEDKYYPRKTLDAEEFLGMLTDAPDAANAVDSPELGPPPIAHFEDGDPTKFDPSEDDLNPSKTLIPEDDIQSSMFANLETRKRRRETTNLREKISLGMDSSNLRHSIATEEPTLIRKSLKTGAKRKLDVASDEDRGAGKDSEDDGFEFGKNRADSAVNKSSRPGPLRGEARESEKGLQEAGVELTHTNIRETSAAISKSRKALGPKSSNMDPTSPSKVRKLGVNSKIGDPKDRLSKRILDSQRLKEKSRNALPSEPKIPDASNLDMEKLRSETPTPTSREVLVPDASEPSSEVRSEPKENQPSDIEPDSSNTKAFDPAERATRRQRGSVSYAEPNLRAKMRRPNKDLADAVKAEEQSKLAIVIPDGETQCQIDSPAENGRLRTMIIKKENFVDSSDPWQIPSSMEDQNQLNQVAIEAISPLESQAKAQPVNELADKTPEEQTPLEKMPENKVSGAGSVIAALSVGRTKSRKRGSEDEGTRETAETRRDTLNSAATDPSADGLAEPTEEMASVASKREIDAVNSTIRPHRRHSSIPKEDGRPGLTLSMARRRERKRESLVGSSSSSISSAGAAAPEVHSGTATATATAAELRSARSVGRLQTGGASGGGGVNGGEERRGGGMNGGGERRAGGELDGGIVRGGVDRGSGRAERAASRRRSMML